MTAVNECPYCSYPLLCHVKAGKPYWLCPRCRREAPYAIASPQPTDLQSPLPSTEPALAPTLPLAEPPAAAIAPLEAQDLTSEASPNPLVDERVCADVNRLIHDFLSTVSHELRTPLSVIRMSARLIELALQQEGLFTAEQLAAHPALTKVAQHLKTLNRECDREIRLVNDLLMLQEFTTLPPPPNPAKIALQAWLPPIIEQYAAQASNKRQKLCVEIPADLPVVETDAALLERIVVELLDNACKFTPNEGKIYVTVMAKLGLIQLEVCNSDTHIPSELENHIFDTFYRVPSDNPWQHSGTGLGLSLAKTLASHLNLTLAVEDYPEATCFVLDIPCPASETLTQLDLLMSYVAYYVSRGKAIYGPHGPLPFLGTVYAHWGYHPDFLQFWHHLQSRADFRELALEADVYAFGEFLGGHCEVLECARCRLPRTVADLGGQDPLHCPCDRPLLSSASQVVFDEPERLSDPLCVLIVGEVAAQRDTLTPWFAQNGVQAILVNTPTALEWRALPAIVHLIILDGNLSKLQAEAWAKRLHQMSRLRGVPIIALSPSHVPLMPWAEQSISITDYAIAPLAGRNLVGHLNRVAQQQPVSDRPELFWFPR